MQEIVVGVDGSEHSVAALRWALEEASVRAANVVALCVWEFPYVLNPVSMFTIDVDVFKQDATAMLEQAVAEAAPEPGLVTRRLIEGAPALRLVEASATADLVVVGSRGRGGFGGLLLGSVSMHVASHAQCPVLVHHEHLAHQEPHAAERALDS